MLIILFHFLDTCRRPESQFLNIEVNDLNIEVRKVQFRNNRYEFHYFWVQHHYLHRLKYMTYFGLHLLDEKQYMKLRYAHSYESNRVQVLTVQVVERRRLHAVALVLCLFDQVSTLVLCQNMLLLLREVPDEILHTLQQFVNRLIVPIFLVALSLFPIMLQFLHHLQLLPMVELDERPYKYSYALPSH